ncbi:MAG TPA: hypothetical protein VK833_10275 [Gillisia sp.]|nr:hypothetical protein [Gillisia sp.]
MKKLVLLLLIANFALNTVNAQKKNPKEQINSALENWHKAAATANFEDYF